MALSRTIQTLSSEIPDGDVFGSCSKGFQSFWKIQRNHTSMDRHTIDHNFDDEISDTLNNNKQKLQILRRQIECKRNESYEKYIESNSKYSKLMQINTLKRKLVKNLNKNIGQIKVKSLEELSGVPLAYRYEASVVTIKGMKPEPRTGQVCMLFKNSIIVLGGHNSAPLKTIWNLSLKDMVWTKIQPSEITKSGHTILLYKHKYAIVFGGMGLYNPFTHQRQCENSIEYYYDITTGSTKRIKAFHEQIVEPRKDHAAIVFGHRMIVFGGCSTKKEYLKDMAVFDFKSTKWSILQYQCGSESTTNFFQHGISQAVFSSYFANSNSTKLASVSYTDDEGFYLFGGVNSQGEPHKLSQFRLNLRVPVVHRLYPEGVGPSYTSPSVIPYKQDTFMILSGERGCRELHLYQIFKNKYTRIECGGLNIRLGGVGSSLLEQQGKYYILFGIHDKGFNSEVISFDIKVRKDSARRRNKANSLYKLSSYIMSNLSQKGSDYI